MLISPIRQFFESHRIRDGRILVGVSGGADSVALLRGLAELASSLQLEIAIGHFDHAIREDSADDALWVENLGKTLQLETCIERSSAVDSSRGSETINLASPPAKWTSEDVARNLRYDFLVRTAQQLQCRWVAIAHTADDQAETVLHHIIRGSGLKGLSGIPATRELSDALTLIRPLLQVRRLEVENYLNSRSQPYRSDSTNSERKYTRNRIRHELMPLLRSEFNPQVEDALFRLSQQSSDMQTTLEEMARKLNQSAILDQQSESVKYRRDILMEQPSGLLREMLRCLWEAQNWPRQALSFAHLVQLAEMVQQGVPSRLSLPGRIEAECRGNLFELRRRT